MNILENNYGIWPSIGIGKVIKQDNSVDHNIDLLNTLIYMPEDWAFLYITPNYGMTYKRNRFLVNGTTGISFGKSIWEKVKEKGTSFEEGIFLAFSISLGYRY